MTWYSLSKLAKELGMSVNTFKKHYIEKYPPDRTTTNYKGVSEVMCLRGSLVCLNT